MDRIHYSFRDERHELHHEQIAATEAGALIGYLLGELSKYRAWAKCAPASAELVQQWIQEATGSDYEQRIATQAARWGWEQRGAANEAELQKARDEEFQALIHWLITGPYGASIAASTPNMIADLRAARRPEPPSLKEQALQGLDYSLNGGYITPEAAATIRRALEALPDA